MYYTVAQLRQIEHAAAHQGLALMPRAGAAAADFISQRFGPQARVLVLVGPGNNGGDALVAATLLRQRGLQVTTVMPSDPAQLPADAAQAYAGWRAAGGVEITTLPAGACQVVIDGLFGIGLNRPLQADWQTLIAAVNARAEPVLALDVPSGIIADSGAVPGAAIQASWTLSFIGRARGLATGAALDYVGESHLTTLDLPAALLPAGEIATTAAVATINRQRDSHKGSFGSVAIVGGCAGMVGAALLAGRAALHAGAGKVLLGLLDERIAVDHGQPELMLGPAEPGRLQAADVLVIGPGLGQSAAAVALLRWGLASDKPLLLDADALNLIAVDTGLRLALIARPAPTVLTPHPSEAARLLGCDTASVQADRYAAARQLAQTSNSVVVLKGAGSLIDDGQHTAVNQTGSAAMANAGQGDVLSGAIGALLAQRMPAFAAAKLGVWAHGAASDALLMQNGGLVTPASSVAVALGQQLAAIAADQHRAVALPPG